jgi:hypothetical protein
MKWRVKPYDPYNWNSPAAGDERTRNRFAWLPTKLSSDTWAWLEHYVETQRYVIVRERVKKGCDIPLTQAGWLLKAAGYDEKQSSTYETRYWKTLYRRLK